jgi:GT2 family glycosyltransferase
MKNISIIIITYNSQNYIEKCLSSIKDNARKNLRFNLILIDNASSDNSAEFIYNFQWKNLTFIKNNKNIGFAKAVNQGINYALKNFKSDYFLLLNPDAFLEKDCVEKLVSKAVENKYNGLISPLIITPKTRQIWFSGAKIDWLRMRTKHLPHSTAQGLKKNAYLSGCCLLISKILIEKNNLFDERFFLYYEDVDYSLRAQKVGFNLILVEKAICYHNESQSSTSKIKNYHLVKSGLLFFEKHYPGPALIFFWLHFYLRFFYHFLFSDKKEVFQAMKDFLADRQRLKQ